MLAIIRLPMLTFIERIQKICCIHFRLYLKSVSAILLASFCAVFVSFASAAFCRCTAYHRAQGQTAEAHTEQAAEWRRIRDRDRQSQMLSGGKESSRAAGSRGRNSIGCFAHDAATWLPINECRKSGSSAFGYCGYPKRQLDQQSAASGASAAFQTALTSKYDALTRVGSAVQAASTPSIERCTSRRPEQCGTCRYPADRNMQRHRKALNDCPRPPIGG